MYIGLYLGRQQAYQYKSLIQEDIIQSKIPFCTVTIF